MTRFDNFSFDITVTNDQRAKRIGLTIVADDDVDAVLIIEQLNKKLFELDNWFDRRVKEDKK